MSYKDLIKQYGTLAVGFHSVVWTGTLGVTWALVFANADAALKIFELVPVSLSSLLTYMLFSYSLEASLRCT